MTKKKKILIISLFGFILVGVVSAYVIYGSTLIDITNEKSINKYLSDDEKNSGFKQIGRASCRERV